MRTDWLSTIPSSAGKEIIISPCPIAITGTTLRRIHTQPILFLATTEWWAIEPANILIPFLWHSNQSVRRHSPAYYLKLWGSEDSVIFSYLTSEFFLTNLFLLSFHVSTLRFVFRHHALALSQMKFSFWKRKRKPILGWKTILGNKDTFHLFTKWKSQRFSSCCSVIWCIVPRILEESFKDWNIS